jgi:hypothetical protein
MRVCWWRVAETRRGVGNMNEKQKENTSKLLYKFTELTYTGIVVANLIPGKEFNKLSLLIGIGLGLICYLLALWLNRKDVQNG